MSRQKNKKEKSIIDQIGSPQLVSEAAPEVVKSPRVRQSGQFMDQKLVPKYPQPYQQNLLDLISNDDIKGKIERHGITERGINLTPGEDRLMNSLLVLLKDNSENKNADVPEFYTGNGIDVKMVAWAKDDKIAVPTIEITRGDLYKAYVGDSNYSGKDIKNINKALEALCVNRHYIRYDRARVHGTGKNKKKLTTVVEMFDPLIELENVTKDLTDEELIKFNDGDKGVRENKSKLAIRLHPVVIDQIANKYVYFPQDISQRTAIAAGHPNSVTTALIKLRDYLLRELSNKRWKCQINKETLIYQLHLTKYKEEGRRAPLEKRINQAIDVCTEMEIIVSHELKKGADGQDKYVFTLNKDFR